MVTQSQFALCLSTKYVRGKIKKKSDTVKTATGTANLQKVKTIKKD